MKKVLTYTGFLGIAALGLYLAFSGENMDEIIDQILSANKIYVFIAMVFGYLAIVSRGIRWIILLEPLGHKPKLWNSIHSVALAYLANIVVPRSGEIARCGALNRIDGIPMDELIGTVISERVVDFVMLFIFLFVAVITNGDAFYTMYENWIANDTGEPSNKLLYTGIVFGLIVLLIGVFWKKIKASNFYGKVSEFLAGVKTGLKSVMKMKKKWAFIFHTLFIWFMYFMMAYVVFFSMEETSGVSIFKGLFIMVAGGFGMVFPAPGGVGSYQYAVKLAFIALGMSSVVGLAYGNLEWFAQTLMMIVAGSVGLIMLGRAKMAKNKTLEN